MAHVISYCTYAAVQVANISAPHPYASPRQRAPVGGLRARKLRLKSNTSDNNPTSSSDDPAACVFLSETGLNAFHAPEPVELMSAVDVLMASVDSLQVEPGVLMASVDSLQVEPGVLMASIDSLQVEPGAWISDESPLVDPSEKPYNPTEWIELAGAPQGWCVGGQTLETCADAGADPYAYREQCDGNGNEDSDSVWQQPGVDVWAQQPTHKEPEYEAAAPEHDRVWRTPVADVWGDSQDIPTASTSTSTSSSPASPPPEYILSPAEQPVTTDRRFSHQYLQRVVGVGAVVGTSCAMVLLLGNSNPALQFPVLDKHMLDRMLVIAPTVFSLVLQCSGMAAIHKIKQDSCTGDMSPSTFFSLFTNCSVWCVYAALIQDMACLVPNMSGALFGLYYSYVFAKNTAVNMRPYYLGSAAVVTSAITSAILGGPDVAEYIGLVGAAACVVLLSSPLATARTVMKTKSTASMTFAICLASFCNAFSWVAYGLAVENLLIIVPNGLGLLASVVQLSLFALFPSRVKLADQVDVGDDFAYDSIAKTA